MNANNSMDELRRFTFKTGRQLLDKYGFEDWKVAIDTRPRSRRRGQCRYQNKEIGISECFLKREAERAWADTFLLKTVIIHEVAHALTPKSHHWSLWKRQYARLLWAELGGNMNLVESGLLLERHCRERASQLVRFAITHQHDPITILSPEKAVAAIRTFPVATRQIVSLEHGRVDSFWMMSEAPMTFLCAELGDQCGTGKLRRFRKEDVFLDADEARQALLNRCDNEIERYKNYLPHDDPDKHEMLVEMIQEREKRKQAILGSIAGWYQC